MHLTQFNAVGTNAIQIHTLTAAFRCHYSSKQANPLSLPVSASVSSCCLLSEERTTVKGQLTSTASNWLANQPESFFFATGQQLANQQLQSVDDDTGVAVSPWHYMAHIVYTTIGVCIAAALGPCRTWIASGMRPRFILPFCVAFHHAWTLRV
eukprot:m.307364 g.307364  ORF g.307364 m.307364 type:complete len:153 (-) comp15934_c0_seq10:3399-3857(-)